MSLRDHPPITMIAVAVVATLVATTSLHAQETDGAPLPIPQTHEDQPVAQEESSQQPNRLPGVENPSEAAPLPTNPGRDVEPDEPPEPPDLDGLRITALSLWLGANVAIAAGYVGAGFFVEGPLAIVWGGFGGAFLLAPLGGALGIGIGALLGYMLWQASTASTDRPEAESAMEVILRQVDGFLRGARVATLGLLFAAGSGAIGGVTFALLGGIVGGLVSEQPGFLRTGTYIGAGASLAVTSVAVGIGAYFAHQALDGFTGGGLE